MGLLLIDLTGLTELAMKFAFDIIVTILLVRFLYFDGSRKRQKEYVFSFLVSNVLVFFLCHLMSGAEISMGFAFGLFAVFGILRFRTRTLPIKEMTYLFASISVALINGLSIPDMSIYELLFINVAILISVLIMERFWLSSNPEQPAE